MGGGTIARSAMPTTGMVIQDCVTCLSNALTNVVLHEGVQMMNRGASPWTSSMCPFVSYSLG